MLNRILAGVEVLAGIVHEDVDLGVSLVDLVTEPQQQGLFLASNGRHCWQRFCLLTRVPDPEGYGHSGSFSKRSGSFHHQAKLRRKNP